MSGILSVTPEPAIANSVKTCNSKVNHSGHRFQDETFGDIEPQADHPSSIALVTVNSEHNAGIAKSHQLTIWDGKTPAAINL